MEATLFVPRHIGTRHQLTGINALNFIFSGKATFTVKNAETGNRYTYKIIQPKAKQGEDPKRTPHFVKVLTGSDNESSYHFIGSVFGKEVYRHAKKSKITTEATSVKVFTWILDRLVKNNVPKQIEIWHEGKCGRCGRKLTVPDSITIGIGPECLRIREDEESRQQMLNFR